VLGVFGVCCYCTALEVDPHEALSLLKVD